MNYVYAGLALALAAFLLGCAFGAIIESVGTGPTELEDGG
jgi:hypothetical protein